MRDIEIKLTMENGDLFEVKNFKQKIHFFKNGNNIKSKDFSIEEKT